MSFLSKLGKVAMVAAPIAAGIALPGVGGIAAGGLMSKIGSMAGKIAPVAGAIGGALSKGAQASADNRGSQIDALIAQQKLNSDQNAQYENANLRRAELEGTNARNMNDALLARDIEGRASGKDALKSIQHASYISGGGAQGAPNALGFGPKAANATEMQGAKGFEAELMKRLEGGNQVAMPTAPGTLPEISKPTPFQIDPKLTKGGTLENLSGIAGAGLSMWDLLNRKNQNTGIFGGVKNPVMVGDPVFGRANA